MDFKKMVLDQKWIEEFKNVSVKFGFNGLGEVVYKRTYSRLKENGEREEWYETVGRVVNGTFRMLERHCKEIGVEFEEKRERKRAEEMYKLMFEFKFLPPGRGLWAMGSAITESKQNYAALNNCAFVSTEEMWKDPSKPYAFLMDMSMNGVGVGFDTNGALDARNRIFMPNMNEVKLYEVPDSRDGWVSSVRLLLDSYMKPDQSSVKFDYSKIREKGQPLKTFGGVASGSGPLIELHERMVKTLDKNIDETITVRTIVDLMNQIGCCVVSGNIRRSAEIAFGEYDDGEFISLKDYEQNPERVAWGWSSNNSIKAKIGMDFSEISPKIKLNGEPGCVFLENSRSHQRMNGHVDKSDSRCAGLNPCAEISLESYELCNLVETFPSNHDTLDEYLQTLYYAHLYVKIVSLGNTAWSETNRVLLRNRRVGVSMSGIVQFINKFSLHTLKEWCNAGYEFIQDTDIRTSEELCVRESIRRTTIKPSGTVSLLAGATPGMHYPQSKYYIRRMRISKTSHLYESIKDSTLEMEDDVTDPDGTAVVSFYIFAGEGLRTTSEVSIWEQLSLQAFLQREWSDNAVSCTVTFDPKKEGGDIENALNYFQYQLKGTSFLPSIDYGSFPQMPYETITEQVYNEKKNTSRGALKRSITPSSDQDDSIPQEILFCDGDKCNIKR